MGRGSRGSAAKSTGAETKSAPNQAATRAPEIRRSLLRAYDAWRRELPWRGETDPYRIWVSEVMLQQTRVETVIPYYKEWIQRFPDLMTLASAEEDEVLRAWQGLGYYSRARNLHGAARVVREELGGSLPASASELRALPGVGEYTAGAVASIAFGEVVPAVDGNVRRVVSRLFDLPDPGAKELRKLAGELVDPGRPGDFNQALMELGALVCTPRSPACGSCPIDELCLALERGTVGERPEGKARRPVPELDVAVVVGVVGRSPPGGGRVGRRPHRFLVRKRPSKGLLAGMWEFPGVEVEGGSERSWDARVAEAARALARDLGIGTTPFSPDRAGREAVPGGSMEPIPVEVVTHLFTHLKIHYWPFVFLGAGGAENSDGGRWLTADELDRVPLPVAQRKILRAALTVIGDSDARPGAGGENGSSEGGDG